MATMAQLSLFVVCFCVLGAVYSLPKQDFEENQKRVANHLLHRYKTNATFARLHDYWERERNAVSREDFPCNSMLASTKVPTSVHKLRPADVRVVGAVGDSLTAGRGVKDGVIGLLFDYPQYSWSIGGRGSAYEKQITIPNTIRKYNPDVVGAAESSRKWVFNKAVSGATSIDMLNQTIDLVKAMKDDSRVDYENDWKVITMFIGGNDLCAICDDYEFYSPKNYIKRVQEGLDYLHKNVPRAFVNLVEILNVEMVQELSKTLVCDAVHLYVCACGAFPAGKEAAKKVTEYRENYQINLRELVASGRYDTRDDFTVVLQPFYRDTYPPYKSDGKLDLSYFASDCFHLSSKGQQVAAQALWNNMVEPVGSKRLNWHPQEALECPNKRHPFFYTAKNSA